VVVCRLTHRALLAHSRSSPGDNTPPENAYTVSLSLGLPACLSIYRPRRRVPASRHTTDLLDAPCYRCDLAVLLNGSSQGELCTGCSNSRSHRRSSHHRQIQSLQCLLQDRKGLARARVAPHRRCFLTQQDCNGSRQLEQSLARHE